MDKVRSWTQYEDRQHGHSPFEEAVIKRDGYVLLAPGAEEDVSRTYEKLLRFPVEVHAGQIIGRNMAVLGKVTQLNCQ